jgi:hypothetical protein
MLHTNNNIYIIAGHKISIEGEHLATCLSSIYGFSTFLPSPSTPLSNAGEGVVLRVIERGSTFPMLHHSTIQYLGETPIGKSTFGYYEGGLLFSYHSSKGEYLQMWGANEEPPLNGCTTLYISGDFSPFIVKFALWVAYSLAVLPLSTVSIHASSLIYNGMAVLCLGESGTGKSTHTRLWNNCIKGTSLLNDDSPFVKVEGERIMAYGSPWSGKTHCYHNEGYPVAAFVRLWQAPENIIERLSPIEGYAALHPSAPPHLAYDERCCDHVCNILDSIVSCIPVYKMGCTPTQEAAEVSFKAIFG